jgi:hypothetical protein
VKVLAYPEGRLGAEDEHFEETWALLDEDRLVTDDAEVKDAAGDGAAFVEAAYHSRPKAMEGTYIVHEAFQALGHSSKGPNQASALEVASEEAVHWAVGLGEDEKPYGDCPWVAALKVQAERLHHLAAEVHFHSASAVWGSLVISVW